VKPLRHIITRALVGPVIKAKKKEAGGALTHGAMRHYALGGSPMATFSGTKWDAKRKKRVLRSELIEKYLGFNKLKSKLKAQGASNPGGLAAYIGRKKYGAKKFNKAAKTHHKMNEEVLSEVAPTKSSRTWIKHRIDGGMDPSLAYALAWKNDHEGKNYRKAGKGQKHGSFTKKTGPKKKLTGDSMDHDIASIRERQKARATKKTSGDSMDHDIASIAARRKARETHHDSDEELSPKEARRAERQRQRGIARGFTDSKKYTPEVKDKEGNVVKPRKLRFANILPMDKRKIGDDHHFMRQHKPLANLGEGLNRLRDVIKKKDAVKRGKGLGLKSTPKKPYNIKRPNMAKSSEFGCSMPIKEGKKT
jgi:hypothetical protein